MNNLHQIESMLTVEFSKHGFAKTTENNSSVFYQKASTPIEVYYDRKTLTLFYKKLPFYEVSNYQPDELLLKLAQVIPSIGYFAQTIDWVSDLLDDPMVEIGTDDHQYQRWYIHDNNYTGQWEVNWVNYYNPKVPTQVKAKLVMFGTRIIIKTKTDGSFCSALVNQQMKEFRQPLSKQFIQEVLDHLVQKC